MSISARNPAALAPASDAAVPLPEARSGWIVVVLFFGVFLGFAAFVRLDAAAAAQGSVKVSGSRQTVQHRDGGIVSALRVREGQHVRAGQVLIELAGAEVAANERALAAQVIGLQAEHTRLVAEQAGAADVATPADFAALNEENRRIAADAMRLQRAELAARRRAVSAQKSVLGQQAAQLDQKIAGLGQQIDATRRQNQLYGDQLDGMRDLAKKGFASVNRVRDLERAQASLSGDTANLAATSAAARAQIGETRMQALSIDSQHQQQIADDLHRNEAALNDAMPRWLAARRQLDLTQIRAPASGQVIGLAVFTVGGVIAPGQKLMDIVPDAAPLVVDATVSPGDADDLAVGQTAELRFPTLHDRSLPVFEGTITRLSPDSLVNEKTGAVYYTGEVSVPAASLARIKAVRGGAGIRPGLPVEILVPLRKRTLLTYLLEPINQALWRGGREH